ncbi:MAG: hypothetical protein V1676_01645 [Candidatus Diapherotrites archaeon]
MDRNRYAKVLFLFALTYVIIYVLSVLTPMRDWGPVKSIFQFDYMFYLLPVVGFGFLYMLPPWFNGYFGTKFASSPFFPLAYAAIAVAAYYVSMSWYMGNIAQLSGVASIPFDIVKELLNSAYLVFVLAGLGGWVSRVVIERMEPAGKSETTAA